MNLFRDDAEVYETMMPLFETGLEELKKSSLVVQFQYTEPKAVITLTGGEAKSGPIEVKPDVILEMSSNLAHKFWFGKVNMITAMTSKKIVSKGPLPVLLKALPMLYPLYERYPEVLKANGKEHLVIY